MSPDPSIEEIQRIIGNPSRLVRAIFSGRRRNMQPAFEKIEFRPIKIHDKLLLQMTTVGNSKSKTKNLEFDQFNCHDLITSGYANCLVESTDLTLTMRFTKKGVPIIHRSQRVLTQNTSHDRQKSRLLDSNSDFLYKVGITDRNANIKPSMRDKYLQIEEFLRILMPTLRDEISSGGYKSQLCIIQSRSLTTVAETPTSLLQFTTTWFSKI